MKLGSRQIVQVNHKDQSAVKIESDENISLLSDFRPTINSIEDITELIDPRPEEKQDNIFTTTSPNNYLITPPDSSATRTPKETEAMYYDAIEAEKNSKSAKNLLTASFLLLIFPIFGFFLSIHFFAIGSSFSILKQKDLVTIQVSGGL